MTAGGNASWLPIFADDDGKYTDADGFEYDAVLVLGELTYVLRSGDGGAA